jgi:putative nucleotidyltransferase with HDIG domain
VGARLQEPEQQENTAVVGSLLTEAQDAERDGRLPEAILVYERAIIAAERSQQLELMSEGLRRLGAVCDRRDDRARARALCQRSFDVACEIGNTRLAAEALNVLGTVELHSGRMPEARATFERALELGPPEGDIQARVEGNLGIIANIEGDVGSALAHYHRSLEASREAGDRGKCAIAYVNLGITSTQLGRLEEAATYFRQGRAIADDLGDAYLQAACAVNHAKVHVGLRRFDEARNLAESALAGFDRLGARSDKAEAYRVIGITYRETGRVALAESRLRVSMDLAQQSSSALKEAEASRELAVLYDTMGRSQESFALLNQAHRLFKSLNASVDAINIVAKMEELHAAYLALSREWGQSLEYSDRNPPGHCARVADRAVSVARTLGLGAAEQLQIQLGAYLHDVGKVKIPHEILNKQEALTRTEVDVVKMHTVWGVDLLKGVEFPWDVKGIIRWHHERRDGSGFPDGLRGDAIPVAAQIVSIADAYDSLATERPYRRAMSREEALAEMTRERTAWSDEVFVAFRHSLAVRGRAA